jgi:hypothetical protein
MSATVVFAVLGWKALLLMYIWLGSCIMAAALSRSKGYGEKAGLGTGLLLTILGPIIWLLVPPKDELAEWHKRKPWQPRGRLKESDLATMHGTEFPLDEGAAGPRLAGEGDPGAGSRPGESRD